MMEEGIVQISLERYKEFKSNEEYYQKAAKQDEEFRGEISERLREHLEKNNHVIINYKFSEQNEKLLYHISDGHYALKELRENYLEVKRIEHDISQFKDSIWYKLYKLFNK